MENNGIKVNFDLKTSQKLATDKIIVQMKNPLFQCVSFQSAKNKNSRKLALNLVLNE